jgi:hypothetical protein
MGRFIDSLFEGPGKTAAVGVDDYARGFLLCLLLGYFSYNSTYYYQRQLRVTCWACQNLCE